MSNVRRNPATGAPLDPVPATPAGARAERLAAARAAQPGWAALPLAERIAVLARFRSTLVADRETLATLLTREVGKPLAQSRAELDAVLGRIDFFTAHVAEVLAERRVHTEAGLEERLSWEPLGVVANVSAWNYPYFVGANVFVPALLAGNAVLYKPSEICPETGLAITRRLHDAGVPETAMPCLIGNGAVGAELVRRDVEGVFFTGSHATGRRIAEACAGRFLRLQLELGGKDPAYVTDDVDVETAAASLAEGVFYNAGQSCCAVERIYVHDAVHDAFLDALVARAKALRVGDPSDPETELGPLAREPQLAVLEAQVADALAKGAKLRCGGERLARSGWYFAPTVITDATQEMELMREESFGPLIGVARVAGDEEAVARMNDTRYGLTAAVYCRDEARARAILARCDTGSVYWNACDRVSPRLPWSGRRDSGVGATLGRLGIEAFARPKAWHLRAP